MQSILFLISYFLNIFSEIGKKTRQFFGIPDNFFGIPAKKVLDAQELSDEEYNRRFGKFFPKQSETDEDGGSGFYLSRVDAMSHGAMLGPDDGGPGFYY